MAIWLDLETGKFTSDGNFTTVLFESVGISFDGESIDAEEM